MVGISNIYMDRVLSALPLKHYCGVYSIDTIPSNLLSQNFLIILNFSPNNATGTHFVCLCQTKVGPQSRIYLFDSLATPFNNLPNLLFMFVYEEFILAIRTQHFKYMKAAVPQETASKIYY